MGKSRGLRRVSFSSSGAIRTTCLFALKRWVETTRWESNIGIEHLQRTKHAWPTQEEEEEEEEDGDEVEDVYDGDRIARVLKLGTERQIEAINFFFSTLSICICIVVTPLPLGFSLVPLPQHKPSVGKTKAKPSRLTTVSLLVVSQPEPPRFSSFFFFFVFYMAQSQPSSSTGDIQRWGLKKKPQSPNPILSY